LLNRAATHHVCTLVLPFALRGASVYDRAKVDRRGERVRRNQSAASKKDSSKQKAALDPGEPTIKETAESVLAILTSVFPVIGAPVSAFLSDAATSSQFDRVWSFISDLANHLAAFEARSSEYVRADEFQDLLARSLRAALEEPEAGERQREAIALAEHIRTRTLPRVWNVPLLRNPHFQGRDEELTTLREGLLSGKAAALVQAVHGEGGVGKTQIALEYCYRHHVDYDIVWWVPAEDSVGLSTAYVSLAAEISELKEIEFPNPSAAVRSVRRWLERNGRWLLVFDNAGGPAEVEDYLPQGGAGHLAVTSRNPAWGRLGHRLPVNLWPRETSIAFLLERTGQGDQDAAGQIAYLLQDLPLALEHAGAYVEATGCSLVDYAGLLESVGLRVLDDTTAVSDHDSVSATWKVALERVRGESALALPLVQLLAFLAPEELPLMVLQEGGSVIGEPLDALSDVQSLNAAIAVLRRYGLVARSEEGISVHRVLQHAVRASMDERASFDAAISAARLIAHVFPLEADAPWHWGLCAALVPHVRAVSGHASLHDADLSEIDSLLNRAALYLMASGQYKEAEPICRRALANSEKSLEPDHVNVGAALNNLGCVLSRMGRYQEAEPLLRRALAIGEKTPGHDPSTATANSSLADLLRATGQYAESETLYRRALMIDEKTLGLACPQTAMDYDKLAGLLEETGRYEEAETLYRRALAVNEETLGPQHQNVAISLNDLACLLVRNSRYEEAEPLYRRALAVSEETLGYAHPGVAASLGNLGLLLRHMGRYEEAETHLRRALAIGERALGADHPEVATYLSNLAGLLCYTGRHGEAETLYRRALAMDETILGLEHPSVAALLNNLADLLYHTERPEEAQQLLLRACAIGEQALEAEHPALMTWHNNLGLLLESSGRKPEAEASVGRADGTGWERRNHNDQEDD
jgi:tetratricopeptide (TPR) repeat protein